MVPEVGELLKMPQMEKGDEESQAQLIIDVDAGLPQSSRTDGEPRWPPIPSDSRH